MVSAHATAAQGSSSWAPRNAPRSPALLLPVTNADAGGAAAAEWLASNLFGVVGGAWQGGNAPEAAITDAYLAADKQLLVSKGFLGLGERAAA